jgi:hypothetical protein
MRPQGFGQMGAGLDDLGWNDMGFEPPKPSTDGASDPEHDAFGEVVPAHPHNLAGLTPVESPVHKQQAELTGRLSSYSPEDAGEEEEFDETAELYEDEDEVEERVERVARVQALPPIDEREAVVEFEPEAEVEADAEVAREPVGEMPAYAPVEAVEALAPAEPVETVEAFAPAEPIERIAPVPAQAASSAPKRARKPRVAAGSREKAAFTLRLDADRHLKLRLACAVNGRSAQMLVTEALDQLLASMPELQAMAEKARKKG